MRLTVSAFDSDRGRRNLRLLLCRIIAPCVELKCHGVSNAPVRRPRHSERREMRLIRDIYSSP